MGSEDEVRDGGSAKLSYCSEREGVTNNNDLGRRNPWRSGRQEEQCASSQHTINKIFSKEADNINASFPPVCCDGRRCPQSWPCQPGHQGSSGGESKSVKERVNEPIFESWWLGFLSVSFSTLTTAEEPESLKCIWNKTCIYFSSNKYSCKTQTIPRP